MSEILSLRCEPPTSDLMALARALELPLRDLKAHLGLNRYECARLDYEMKRCNNCQTCYYEPRGKNNCPICLR